MGKTSSVLIVLLIPTVLAASQMKLKFYPEMFTNFGFHLPDDFTCPVNDAKQCQLNFVFRVVEDSGRSTTKIVRGLPLGKSGLIEFQKLPYEDLPSDSQWLKTPQTLSGNTSLIIFQIDVYVSDVLLRYGEVQRMQFRLMDSFAHSFLQDLPESAEHCQPRKQLLKGQLMQTNLTLMLGIYCDKNWWGQKCNMTCKMDTNRGYLKCNSTRADTFWCQQIQGDCGFQAINCSYCAPGQIPCERPGVKLTLDKAEIYFIIFVIMAGIAVAELVVVLLLFLHCRMKLNKTKLEANEMRFYETEPHRKVPPINKEFGMIPLSKYQPENIYQSPPVAKESYRIRAQPIPQGWKGRREIRV